MKMKMKMFLTAAVITVCTVIFSACNFSFNEADYITETLNESTGDKFTLIEKYGDNRYSTYYTFTTEKLGPDNIVTVYVHYTSYLLTVKTSYDCNYYSLLYREQYLNIYKTFFADKGLTDLEDYVLFFDVEYMTFDINKEIDSIDEFCNVIYTNSETLTVPSCEFWFQTLALTDDDDADITFAKSIFEFMKTKKIPGRIYIYFVKNIDDKIKGDRVDLIRTGIIMVDSDSYSYCDFYSN